MKIDLFQIKIADLKPGDKEGIRQAADLLVRGFEGHSASWRDIKTALKEVHKALRKGKIARIAINEDKKVLGWIGGLHEYAFVWELHPLVVDPEYQGMGIGRMLVQDLVERVRERGAITLRLGADDEDYRTSISGVDLYPDILEKLANIKNIKGHPYEFYQKVGFAVVGIIPDANGFGKPDIMMARRIIQ